MTPADMQHLIEKIRTRAREGCHKAGTEHFCEQFGCHTLLEIADDLEAALRALPASPSAQEQEKDLIIENLQDALLKVEWVRSHTKSWICAFCGGQSIESGGDDHREGCEWQRLVGWNIKAALAAPSKDGPVDPPPPAVPSIDVFSNKKEQ